jgi:hypothetical protein
MNQNTMGGAGAALPFDQMRQDADELLLAAHRARELFAERSPRTFGRLSTLLDEVLPAEPAAQARIARAVELEPRLLTAIRGFKIDPLEVPVVPLANLANILSLDEETFHALLEADHMIFRARQGMARGEQGDRDPRVVVSAAWRRVEMDLPYESD